MKINELIKNAEEITIISGEGSGEGAEENFDGTRTERALKMALNRERCGGDRWAFAIITDSEGDRFKYGGLEIEQI